MKCFRCQNVIKGPITVWNDFGKIKVKAHTDCVMYDPRCDPYIQSWLTLWKQELASAFYERDKFAGELWANRKKPTNAQRFQQLFDEANATFKSLQAQVQR